MYFPKASLFGRFIATAHALCATEMNCKELPNTGSQDQLLQLSRVISFQNVCKARAAFT